MFGEWCCCFDKNEHRNQFVKGYSSMNSQSSTKLSKHFGVIEFVLRKINVWAVAIKNFVGY